MILLFVIVTVIVINAIAYLLLFHIADTDISSKRNFSFFLLVFIFNFLVLTIAIKYVLSYILFPFANWIMNYVFHYQMNKRMIIEIAECCEETNTIIQDLNSEDFNKIDTLWDYRR